MNINKKYAIRKLAVGVASISIGLFVANSVDNQFGSNISLLKNNSGVVHAACNGNEGVFYALNHYDYETVYEGDSSLPKGEHKDYRAGEEGRQIFSLGLSLCNYFPQYAFGDNDEIEYKPYEVITDKRKNLKAYESYKNEHNLNEKDYDKITEKEKKNIEELWDNLFPNKNEIFFYETRTKKKIIFDESISEPVYKEDGTVIYPKTKVSKTHKNYYGEFLETTMNEENSLDNISVLDRTSKTSFTTVNLVEHNKAPKEAVAKIIKVGNVERIPISTIAIETDYVANNTLDYGVRNTTNQGKEGLRENVVTYEVDRNTGDLKNPTTVENTIPMEKKIVEVGTKEKVVYSKKGNDVIKTTTTYELNTTTGEITPKSTETIHNVGGVKDKVVYSKDGDNIVKETTTYDVNPDNGNITANTTRETFKENGVKDKVVVEKIVSPVRYEKDNTREKGQENITVQGKDGSKTTTTTYIVNPKTGEVEAHSQEPVIVEPTNTIIKVAAKDKIEYSIGNYIEKEDYLEDKNSVYKKTTVYEVNPENGEITENRKVELYKENVMKPKIIKEERIPSPIRYEKDSSRDKGQENITIQGKDGSKITKTVYSLDVNTGEILSYTPKPEITEPTTTTIKVAAKDKVEIVNKDDGSVVKEITTYTVNEKTGEITETKKEEVIKTKTETSKGDELPPVVESKDFNGGVNSDNAPVVENLSELKVAVIKDKENNVLEVIKEDEKPKDIQGYKNTGKTEIDKDGYKVYIYEKVEDKQDSSVDRNKETNEPTTKEKANREENKDNNKETISKKEELPKTSVSMLSTVGLLSIFGLRKNKKKDK